MEKHFLPITKKELDYLRWDYVDVILVSGDAYVDHPSFGPAVIGRVLERAGLRVAILPQPNWKDDLRDFKKLGVPRLFFGVTAGNIDSMLNHYTAQKRLRHDDAYTAGGQAGFRPDYATVTYTKILKQLFPDVPVVIGGIEASMRRLSHYDYWSDTLKPSILIDSGADILVYGMGERPILAIAELLKRPDWRNHLAEQRQIGFVTDDITPFHEEAPIMLHSLAAELKDKRKYGQDFVKFETETNKREQRTMIQPHGDRYVVMRPPYPVATEKEMDEFALFDRMMNAPHPKYLKRGPVPAFEMIKNSITIHRGCFGGCSFCAIAAHQGKQVSSRSDASILAEAEDLTRRDYFKGHITDLGGPSANMFRMEGKNLELCRTCARPSCLHPKICPNLRRDHQPMIELYQKVAKLQGVKHITIGSGIRYELLLDEKDDGAKRYLHQLVDQHVSGRLKVAPEHTDPEVVRLMRKPEFSQFLHFMTLFQKENERCGKNQQLIPYLISAHPGCTLVKMSELSKIAREHHLMTDQVQTFTPTPMTYSTAMYYLEYDPYTGKDVHVAKSDQERRDQHAFFFPKAQPSSHKKGKSNHYSSKGPKTSSPRRRHSS
ncbi:MAG: YgiQ family radical SAM protein [Bacteroidales bacterium]|nr:YgiQ family radical SAM protein [Bacteroidales bacterium]